MGTVRVRTNITALPYAHRGEKETDRQKKLEKRE